MKFKKLKIIAIILVLLFALLIYSSFTNNKNYDEFAKCLNENGTKMYGTYWCGACNYQKDIFKDSWQYIDYIECSLPNKAGRTQICIEKEIIEYPTWEFEDESRLSGVLSFEILSEKTSCEF